MPESYDVVVVGAGPTGAACARHIATHSKHTVLLLDKTQEIGEPKKSTAGTFAQFMQENEIPLKVAMSKIDEVIFEGPTESATIPVEGYVLDFAKFKRFLVEDAVKKGVDLRIEANVNKCILENGKVTGVEYHDPEGLHTISARIVVDATGPTGILSAQLGLRSLKLGNHGIGMEFEMQRLKLQRQRAMLFKFDTRFAPGGYAWIFSTGQNEAKVGVCWYDALFQKQKGQGAQIAYLDNWIKQDPRLTSGITFEMHAGDACLTNVKRRSAANFLAIGDAVGSIHPLLIEGIRPGVASAVMAAQTAVKALDAHDTSAASLSAYDNVWHETIGKRRKFAEAATRMLYTFNNKQYDVAMKNTRKLDHAAIQRFINYEFTARDLLKIYPKLSLLGL